MGQSEYMRSVGVEARKASVEICRASTETKNRCLMREQNYAFKTIEQSSGVELYKDKGSKFYAYAFPIQKETDVKKHIEKLKEI